MIVYILQVQMYLPQNAGAFMHTSQWWVDEYVCVCANLRYFIYLTMLGGLVRVCKSEVIYIPHNGRWTSINVCVCVCDSEVLQNKNQMIYLKQFASIIYTSYTSQCWVAEYVCVCNYKSLY